MGYAVGLMSGTSLDGIDVAFVQIEGSSISSKVEMIDFMMIPFTSSVEVEATIRHWLACLQACLKIIAKC